jgi:hypothetical protein
MSSYIGFESIKNAGLLFLLVTQALVVHAESIDAGATDSEVTDGPASQEERAEFHFPNWPARQQVTKELTPPPPPGPYMSLGLNDFPVSESPFDSKPKKPQVELDSSGDPLQAFNPDLPWPKNIRPTRRWMPENGYQYVDPQVARRPYPAVQNYPANNYGYPSYPNPGWSGSNWMPSMAGRPYPYTPEYGFPYNNSVNNAHIQSGNSGYRAP